MSLSTFSGVYNLLENLKNKVGNGFFGDEVSIQGRFQDFVNSHPLV